MSIYIVMCTRATLQRRMWGEYIHSHVYTCHTTCMASASSYNHDIEPHKIFNPPPQFSRLGIQVSLAISLFVWAMVGWVTLPLFFSFLKALCQYISSNWLLYLTPDAVK